MSTAQFKITGSGPPSPYSDRGFDATSGQVLQLQLEDSPALDIRDCAYVQVGKSKGAPDLVFGSGGVASPPTAAVSVTMPASGVHTYAIECRTNGGQPIRVANGPLDYSKNVKQRIISIRSASANIRKMLVAETTQYSPTGGWADSQNEMVDQVEGAVAAVASVASSAAKLAVVAASTTNIDLSATVSTVNSIAIGLNDRAALFGQANGAENGIYVKGSDNKLTRAPDADSSAEVTPAILVPVQLGTNRGTWVLATTGTITLGTTPLRFIRQSDTYNVQIFGALGDGTVATGATIASGSSTLTVAGLSAADIGKVIGVPKAGASGAPLWTTISNVVGTAVTLAVAAGSTVAVGVNAYVCGTNDTAAIQAAHDALPATGGTLRFPDGLYRGAGLAFTKPVRCKIGRGGLVSGGAASPIITHSHNLVLRGHDAHVTKLAGSAGQSVIVATGPFATGAPYPVGRPRTIFRDVGFDGGVHGWDTTGLVGFYEGMFSFERCLFENTTDKALYIASSVYYGFVRNNIFSQCAGSAYVGNNTETKFTHNVHQPAATGGESLMLDGVHHVHVADQFLAFSPNLAPDVRIQASADGANGICLFDGCKFSAEGLLWQRSDRYAIENYNAGSPQNSTFGITIRHCKFYGPQFLALSSIGRASGIVTATVATLIAAGHGVRVGDKINITQCAGATGAAFNGYFTVTAVTTTTISWAQAGSDVGQSNRNGYVLSGSSAAIRMGSPAKGFVVTDCLFDGYAIGVRRTNATMTEGTSLRGASGDCRWERNTCRGPNGLAFQEFDSAEGPGQFATSFVPGRASPLRATNIVPAEGEELCNRIAHSEDFTAWGNAGITVTAGQADSLGTTRATKLARTGAKWVLGDGAAGPGVYPGWSIADGELVTHALDLTGTPVNGEILIEAKAGSTNQLLAFLYDGTYGVVLPSACLTLSAEWKWYRIPYSYNVTRGALNLCLSPGGFDPQLGDCYVRAVQVSDGKSNSYVKTAGAVVLPDATRGLLVERKATFAGGADLGSQKITNVADPTSNQDAETKKHVSDNYVPLARTITAGAELSGGGDLSANRTLAVTTTQAAAASTIPKLDASSRLATKGIISSGTVPTVTLNGPANAFGTSGVTFTLETGSNDQAGVIIINTGPSPAAAYAFLDLNFSTALPGNLPTINFTIEGHNANFAGGSTTLAGAIEITARTASVVRVYLKNAGVTWAASQADAYRIHYQVVNK
jgi:hypothetical protein